MIMTEETLHWYAANCIAVSLLWKHIAVTYQSTIGFSNITKSMQNCTARNMVEPMGMME